MIQLTEAHFEYGGVSSRQYGLMFANIDTSRNINLVGNVSASNIFSKKCVKNYFLGNVYSDSAFAIDVEIVSDDCRALSTNDRRSIEKWLFHRNGYKKLYFDMKDDDNYDTYEIINGEQKRLYLNCRFTNPTRIEGNGGVVGYKATLEADSPVAWQDEIEFSSSFTSSGNKTVIVNVDTDLAEYIYPKVIMQIGTTGGNITVTNHSDDDSRLTSFVNITPNTQLVVNGELNYISGQNYDKFSNKNFIRLLDGENNISITGDVKSISFIWSNRRWL